MKLLKYMMCCVFSVSGQNILAQGLKYSPVPEFSFDALQCTDMKTSSAYSGRAFCNKECITQEIEKIQPGKVETFTIVQENQAWKTVAFKCKKRKSVLTAVCGMFSHSKLTSPPDVLTPEMISMHDCNLIMQTKTYRTEDNRQIQIIKGSEIQYKIHSCRQDYAIRA